jgi:hypothetical protein
MAFSFRSSSGAPIAVSRLQRKTSRTREMQRLERRSPRAHGHNQVLNRVRQRGQRYAHRPAAAARDRDAHHTVVANGRS